MAIRYIFVTAFSLFLITASLYTVAWLPSLLGVDMTDSAQNTALQVKLSPGSTSSSVRVDVRNNDHEHTMTFLNWDSPLDMTAINTGVLSLEDAQSGNAIPGPKMKINRLLPAPRDDLIELAPGASATRDVELTSPWIPTDGTECRVHFRGTWRAVWAKSASQVTDEDLAIVTGDQRPQAFDSGHLEMRLGG